MNNTFEVGETVIIHNVTYKPHVGLNGEEAIITSLPGSIEGNPDHYGVTCRNTTIKSSAPKYLKRREPPKHARECDRVVSWDDCAWNPHKVKEGV